MSGRPGRPPAVLTARLGAANLVAVTNPTRRRPTHMNRIATLTAAATGTAALGALTSPALAAHAPSAAQARAIDRAVHSTPVGGVARIPPSQYTVAHARVSSVDPAWAYAQLRPTRAYRSSLQGADVFLVRPAGTPNWVVVDIGTGQVGCRTVPDEAIADLLGHDADCDPDPTALVRTAQSPPVANGAGPTRSVVGQAAITAGGRLIVRLAGATATGERALAQDGAAIPDAVSDPAKAGLTIVLRADGTGSVSVIGPMNRTRPDSVVYRLAWGNGDHPSIRLAGVGV